MCPQCPQQSLEPTSATRGTHRHGQNHETTKAHTIRSFWKRRIDLYSSARFSSCSPNRWSRKAFNLPRWLYSCNNVFFLCNCPPSVLKMYWMALWPQMPKSCSSYTLLNFCKWNSSFHNSQVRGACSHSTHLSSSSTQMETTTERRTRVTM